MREIKECTAEVFRRSEKRIKERKRNRNRILAMCIPLCLILTVFSFSILPEMMPKDNAENEAVGSIHDGADGMTQGSKAHDFICVSVRSAEYDGEITDAVAVNKVFYQIYNILEINGGYKDATEGSNDNAGDAAAKENSSDSIVIIMIESDGTARTYILDGNVLYDESFDKEITLTNEQRNDLLVALELADY